MRETDVADVETILRLAQSVPSKKGGGVSKRARVDLEKKTNKKVVSGRNFLKSGRNQKKLK